MQIHNNVAFNQKSPQKSQSFGSVASMSNEILNGKISKIAKAIEFDNINMSFPILLTAMGLGVFVPRLIQAQDKYDREEICRRDLVSISTLVFGAPAISKLFSKINENKSGFALAIKPKDADNKNIIQKVVNWLIPHKGRHILSSEQIISKYSNLEEFGKNIPNIKESEKGIIGFCNFVNEQKGNLKKIFDFTPETKEIMQNICGDAYQNADNKTIIDAIKAAVDKSDKSIKELYEQFAKKDNAFVLKAKSMNSKFGFIAMVCLVPLFLGILIPKLNERITKKKIKKQNTQIATPDQNKSEQALQTYKNPYFMSVQKSTSSKFEKIAGRFSKNEN